MFCVLCFFQVLFFFPFFFPKSPLSPERRNTGQRASTGGPARRKEACPRPPGKTQQLQLQQLQLQKQQQLEGQQQGRPRPEPRPSARCRSGSPGTTTSPGQPQQQPKTLSLIPLPLLPSKQTKKSSARGEEGTPARRRPLGTSAPPWPATPASAPLGCPAASRK